MKKLLLFVLISVAILLLIINYRTPFLQQEGGPWSVGFGSSETFPEQMDFKKNGMFSMAQLKAISDSTAFLADPFFIKEKDTFYLFIEHKKKNPNADIAVMTSVDGKNYKFRGTVLHEKFHLSFPQVYKYKGEFYMVPESKQAGAVLLYKSHKFPFDWRIQDTLLKDVRLKDPSIYLSDSLNIMVASDDNLNMFMYRADSLTGKWTLHPKPIVQMGTEARAGGRFFPYQGGLLLPVQNSTHGYGYGLSLYKFDFKKENYTVNREKPFFLKANDSIPEFNAGMHQFDVQFIDGNYYFVYDGNSKASDKKQLNFRGPLKWTYIDLKNWWYQQ